MGNGWREVRVLLVTAGQKQEPLAACSSNEKGFSLSWLKVSKQAGTTELTLCGAVENQPEQKSEMMGGSPWLPSCPGERFIGRMSMLV